MSKPIEALLPMVVPFAHSCPEIIAVEAIRNSAIEFCERSLWLQEQVPAIAPIAGVSNYRLMTASPLETGVADIMHLWLGQRELRLLDMARRFGLTDLRRGPVAIEHGQRELRPASVDRLATMFGCDWRTVTSAPAWYTTIESQDVIVLAPTPDAGVGTDTLNAIIAVRPLRSSSTLNDILVERWGEAIAFGARARLHMMIRQPWYDAPLATAEAREFRALTSEATIKRTKDGTREVTVVRPRRI